MTALRLQKDASFEEEDLQAELSDQSESSEIHLGKNHGKPGRPRGKGRAKRSGRGLTKKRSDDSEEWQDRGRARPTANREQSSIQGYVRIIDYLKKIDYDQTSVQNKMNPYNALTATCFWYAIGAEYYSFDFFSRRNPHDTAMEILERVHRIPLQLSTRVLRSPTAGGLLAFENQELNVIGGELGEKMGGLIATPMVGRPETVERRTVVSSVSEDDQFICSTRTLLYNYISKKVQTSEKWAGLLSHYANRVQQIPAKQFERAEMVQFQQSEEPLKQTNLFDLLRGQTKKKVQKKQKKKEAEDLYFQEEDIPEVEQKKQQVQKENLQLKNKAENIIEEEARSENHIEQQLHQLNQPENAIQQEHNQQHLQEDHAEEMQAENDAPEQNHTFIKKYTQQDLMLDAILQMPLDKVISILQSSIPTVQLPQIKQTFMPIPTKDPLQFVYQLHPEQEKYLQYMKAHRKKLYRQKVSKSEGSIEEEDREGQFEDAKCQICTDGDYTDDNLIVFCSMCNISLHQRCVGLAKVPAESWICEVCQAFGPAGINLPCPLCNVKGGAMKRTSIHIDVTLFRETNPSYYQYSRRCPYNKQREQYVPHERPEGEQEKVVRVVRERGEKEEECYYDYFVKSTYPSDVPMCHYVWVHYVCAIWVPECYFQQKNGAISVKGIENIERRRFRNECLVCRKSRCGAAVKCEDSECEKYYHPECARKKKVYMEQLNLDKLKYLIFCEQHEPLKLTRQIEYKKKKAREEIIKFARMIEKYIETYRIAQFPFKLMKSLVPAFIDTAPPPHREEAKDHRQIAGDASDQQFVKDLINHLHKFKMMTVHLQKSETGYRITSIDTPSKRQIRKCLNRYDQFWSSMQNGETNQQNFRRYERIMAENQRLREKLQYFLSGSLSVRPRQEEKREKRVGRKRGKHAVQQVQALIEEEGGIFCVCKKPYGGETDMFECEVCGEWYHFGCVGFIGSEYDARDMQFACMKCMKFEDAAKKRQRLEKYNNLFSADSILYNYRPPTPQLMSQEESRGKNYTDILEEAKKQEVLMISPKKNTQHEQHTPQASEPVLSIKVQSVIPEQIQAPVAQKIQQQKIVLGEQLKNLECEQSKPQIKVQVANSKPEQNQVQHPTILQNTMQ